MAKSTALSKIIAEAKRMRKAHPHKYDKKKNGWATGYMKDASKKYNAGSLGAKKSPKRSSRPKTARKKTARKKKPTGGRKLVKQVERSSVERVMAGKRRKRRTRKKHTSTRKHAKRRVHHRKRRVVMAGHRRRRVGKGGGTNTLLILGLGAAALWFLSKPSTPATPYNLPPIQQTGNVTRNTQSTNIVQYAVAAGLAIDAISSLIDRLNNSSDSDVTDIYDNISTTGDFSNYV